MAGGFIVLAKAFVICPPEDSGSVLSASLAVGYPPGFLPSQGLAGNSSAGETDEGVLGDAGQVFQDVGDNESSLPEDTSSIDWSAPKPIDQSIDVLGESDGESAAFERSDIQLPLPTGGPGSPGTTPKPGELFPAHVNAFSSESSAAYRPNGESGSGSSTTAAILPCSVLGLTSKAVLLKWPRL